MSYEQLALETALKLYGSNHGTGSLDRPIVIIQAAIEKAATIALNDGYKAGAESAAIAYERELAAAYAEIELGRFNTASRIIREALAKVKEHSE